MSDLSVELQSQGKPVAEVQVTNMKAGVTRRPYNTNLAMSVHSIIELIGFVRRVFPAGQTALQPQYSQ